MRSFIWLPCVCEVAFCMTLESATLNHGIKVFVTSSMRAGVTFKFRRSAESMYYESKSNPIIMKIGNSRERISQSLSMEQFA